MILLQMKKCSNEKRIEEQAKFTYSSLEKAFESK